MKNIVHCDLKPENVLTANNDSALPQVSTLVVTFSLNRQKHNKGETVWLWLCTHYWWEVLSTLGCRHPRLFGPWSIEQSGLLKKCVRTKWRLTNDYNRVTIEHLTCGPSAWSFTCPCRAPSHSMRMRIYWIRSRMRSSCFLIHHGARFPRMVSGRRAFQSIMHYIDLLSNRFDQALTASETSTPTDSWKGTAPQLFPGMSSFWQVMWLLLCHSHWEKRKGENSFSWQKSMTIN